MGVDYDVKIVFGVEYSFDELKNFYEHHETQTLANDIGTNHLLCLWSETEHCTYSSPYFDADDEYCSYMLGHELDTVITPENMYSILNRTDEIKTIIREFSKKYNIQNKENDVKIIVNPHIW